MQPKSSLMSSSVARSSLGELSRPCFNAASVLTVRNRDGPNQGEVQSPVRGTLRLQSDHDVSVKADEKAASFLNLSTARS